MQRKKELLLDSLLAQYRAYFDIKRDLQLPLGNTDAKLLVLAEFHSRSERYVLVKSAKLWAAESNEYIFIVDATSLDAQSFGEIAQIVLKEGLAKIVPHSEHMLSYVTLIVLADDITVDGKMLLKRTKYRKNYRLAFHGWMDFRIVAVNLSDNFVVSNRAGKEIAANLSKNIISKLKEDFV